MRSATSITIFNRLLIILGWTLLGAIAYRASLEHEIVKPDFDPFEIFRIEKEDNQDFEVLKKLIKSINRKLSKDKHPDRLRQNGFRKIQKREFRQN